MKRNKDVDKRTRRTGKGVNFSGDVNAVVVTNDEDSSSGARVTSRQRIVQRSGRTVLSEQETSDTEETGR